MKKRLLFIVLSLGLLVNSAMAEKKTNDEVQKRSSTGVPAGPNMPTTFPSQFNETNTVRQGPNRAASTGYYFVDNADPAPAKWRPDVMLVDTTFQPTTWRRIFQGPRVLDSTFWQNNTSEGLRFFRNPSQARFFEHRDDNNNVIVVDSTNDAIAGPIPIGFGFYFNGIRYDSFYVSTNGVISLTNRRYFYNSAGQRFIPPGAATAYDPMSMDWFVASRPREGNGLTDPTPDDFGYQFSVLNNQPGTANAGIRSAGGADLGAQITATNKGAYIAPFWGPLHLSQWSTRFNRPDDHGKVYYKREIDATKLTIYIVNIAPQAGTYQFPNGQYGALSNRRPGDPGYVSASAQVVLNRMDSSVTFLYTKFLGSYPTGAGGRRPTGAAVAFGVLTTSGVAGWARDANYDSKDPNSGSFPWGLTATSEYPQSTHYFSRTTTPSAFPYDNLSVKFKQWRNSLRVVDIQYRVRDENTAPTDLNFTKTITTEQARNYELLAGEPKLGALQPTALIQNLSNDIQGPFGVNFAPQDANFVARFRIINLATYSEHPVTKFRDPIPRVIYNRFIRVTEYCLNLAENAVDAECGSDPFTLVRYSTVQKSGNNYNATHVHPLTPGLNGIPPYGYVQVQFPPFEPNEYVPDHIGRMRAFIIADALTSPDPTKPAIGGEWPFDDTTNVDFIVMRRLSDFSDDFSGFHSIFKVNMPSVYKWVNVGTTVVDGETSSRYPLPPRGLFEAINSSSDRLRSPAVNMNRKTIDNADWSPNQNTPGGDRLTSFPIDLRNKSGAVLSFSVQRTFNGPDVRWNRGWSDQQINAVEGRLISNMDVGTLYTTASAVSRPQPDSLVVEFMRPSPDGIKNIVNVTDESRWRWHPLPATPTNPNPGVVPGGPPAFALFGSGGYFMGWDEQNPNRPLRRDPTPNPSENGLRANIFDDGIDWEYQRFQVGIPDAFINAPNEGGKNFRFRFRVQARNHNKGQGMIEDDNDDFLVDNVRISLPTNKPDLEVNSVKIVWPYEVAPATQATHIPIRVNLSNNTNINAQTFNLKVKVFRGQSTWGDPLYCRVASIPSLNARRNLEVSMPTWDAKITGEGEYRIQAIVLYDGGDAEPLNDTTYTDVNLVFGEVFAYDDPNNEFNDVSAFTNWQGTGLNLSGQAYGGTNAGAGSYTQPIFLMGGNGAGSGNSSGQFAVKFELFNTDTLHGFQTLFANLNQAMDDISFSIYFSSGDDNSPGVPYPNSFTFAKRGLGSDMTVPAFNRYVTYKMKDFNRSPLVLNKGTYWVAIGQMGLDGIHLGGSGYRMGMRTTSQYVDALTGLAGGALACNLMIDKQFRKLENNNLINNNFFAYENMLGSGDWQPFMTTFGNPAFAHLHHWGVSPQDNTTQTFSRGTFIPMIRPYFGSKYYDTEEVVEICPDDIPVELISFRGDVRANVGIDLFWETASEVNNYGFYVEKRLNGESDEDWQSIYFKEGANNSNTIRYYNHTDRNVVLNNTYQYRLRQVDTDGSQYCSTSDIITKTYDLVDVLTIDQNYPNPFNNTTSIRFNMPTNQKARIEVIDLLGNSVKVLLDSELNAGMNEVSWDGRNANGAFVPSGTYIYRLTTGDEIISGKMTFIK